MVQQLLPTEHYNVIFIIMKLIRFRELIHSTKCVSKEWYSHSFIRSLLFSFSYLIRHVATCTRDVGLQTSHVSDQRTVIKVFKEMDVSQPVTVRSSSGCRLLLMTGFYGNLLWSIATQPTLTTTAITSIFTS